MDAVWSDDENNLTFASVVLMRGLYEDKGRKCGKS